MFFIISFKQIGKDNVTDEMIKQIRSKIEKQDITHIKKQLQFAPVWIAKIMRALINEN
jgi:RNA-binding protein YhbY